MSQAFDTKETAHRLDDYIRCLEKTVKTVDELIESLRNENERRREKINGLKGLLDVSKA